MFDVEGVDPAAVDALRPFLPKLRIMVDEVGSVPDEELTGQGVVRLTLLLFKHGRGPNVLHYLPQWENEFRILVSRGDPGLRNLELLVEYLLTVNEHVSVDSLGEFLAPIGDKAREIPMTVGQQLRKEGLKEGLQKGRQEGRREALLQTARKALAKSMSPADVAELTDLPLEDVQRLSH